MASTSSTTTSMAIAEGGSRYPWLFNPQLDLLAFLGSAVAALGLLALGEPLGLIDADTPDWIWIATILLIDVAHVYATGFSVYFVPEELKRHPWLYGLTPLLGFAIAWWLYQQGAMVFWRALAYLAVFHFVRQQYGWMALYRAKEGDTGRLGWWIDTVAIYMATVYPLVYWHTHLPRKFAWFLEGDFIALPLWLSDVAAVVYGIALGLYCLRVLKRSWMDGRFNPGKEIMLATTVVCWYVGIIALDSDYAFTVTNVITHGVPYLVLVYWVQQRSASRSVLGQRSRWVPYLAILWGLAYFEEFLWDVGVWHERSWLFGSPQNWAAFHSILVPLLALPQITHYILDGFIWRRRVRSNV
ncbi:MAG: hypothetical protein ACK57P_03985 [Planctomycetota bacterium]